MITTIVFFQVKEQQDYGLEEKANGLGTPLQIQTVREANDNEMRELKEFYEACEVRFCVKVLI